MVIVKLSFAMFQEMGFASGHVLYTTKNNKVKRMYTWGASSQNVLVYELSDDVSVVDFLVVVLNGHEVDSIG